MPQTTNGSAKRQCESWIESFVRKTEKHKTPLLFRKWVAIATLAASLEQRVYITTHKGKLYCHMYTFILGESGVGKNTTIRLSDTLLRTLVNPDEKKNSESFHLGPMNVTRASLTDLMVEAHRSVKVWRPGEGGSFTDEFHSITLIITELQAFLPKADDELIGILTAFYDQDIFAEAKRGSIVKIRHSVKRPQLNLIVGGVPSNLNRVLPEQAWNEGFISRSMMIFTNVVEKPVDMFADTDEIDTKDLEHDLLSIFGMYGNIAPDEECRNAYNNWMNNEELGEKAWKPHPKLKSYAVRRKAHLLKLIVISCVSRTDTMIATKEDFKIALAWLLEAEHFMPMIFDESTKPTDAQVMDEISWFISKHDRGTGVLRSRVYQFAASKVNAYQIRNIIGTMSMAGMLVEFPLHKGELEPRFGVKISKD